MTCECWCCGKPIRRNEPAESLPGGPVAVHAACLRRDDTSAVERDEALEQAA